MTASGFALITETRIVHLPAGLSRLRFEGVADGIEPASAIVTGLPQGVIEKNRDAQAAEPGGAARRRCRQDAWRCCAPTGRRGKTQSAGRHDTVGCRWRRGVQDRGRRRGAALFGAA